MRKLISILIVISILFTFTACGGNGDNKGETTTSSTVSTEPVETTLQSATGDTLLALMEVSLVSLKTNDFSKMHFSDYIQSSIEPSDKGTAMTMLLRTTTDSISLRDVESVAIKSPTGMPVNMSTDVFFLNNEKCCIIFAKTEGIHKTDDYAVLVKTKDGAEKLFPIPQKATPDVINKYVTDPGQAMFGDLIKIKDRVYFIYQSGSLSSVVYSLEDKKFTKVTLGTALIPLENDFTYKLSNDDFTSVFYDIDNYGDYNVVTELSVNDADALKTYKDNYKGLFTELITCEFTLEVNPKLDTEQSTARRDYVMNNTWIKATFEEDFLYKLYKIPR